ncbi:S1-like domain-containing RNA-binding protein [Limosilactobacillus mucosae]|uniref:S1-like domain-containing RNA-binding protein n=1 Tax=Limosilactobacillus mucosae TaxID=97478 RepID=A0AAJ1HV17_LIMMU|nr:S1-like domain-containing RNA-binding protein [Limosilactobacillus mucosae]MDC2829989.1 S1-like domain-containing RNA-binding protein [Limosilactobacillus mucosae]MDC2837446.1 S1-like domain-containing RNA-binding protein [Limosilactobacillus mucosae]MDC2839544.1 S1-like domain-containing RNA-binding protein [Limosilactobacillus mucosae]MDC2849723.1 S1-like domain-containing RNA-binding protein [Limosilactobacillus mucosae]MDC2853713.1 S1-like domain-containing RNA-binding protein [Limosila
MNSVLGKVVDAVMIDENDHDYFVQPARNGQTYRLPKDESPQVLHIGGSVRGFVYENENHQLQMTCQHIPTVQVDHYDFGTVVGVRRDLGVFVDIGLPNKDIVVSLDDLPSLKHLWPQKGDRLMMALKVDDKNRIWGQLADESVFEAIANRPNPRMKNKDVKATVYRLKMAGTFVITDDYCLGFIHPSERDQEPRLGQRISARVIGLSSHGSLNLSLKPRAYQAIGEDAQMLLEMLRRTPDHTLPFTDKSDPEAIRQEFGISKGQFKRAVGHLLKARMVSMVNGKLILIKDPDDK